MNLTAAVIIRDELDRYLGPCVDHLLEFCDEVRILDDGSTDGWEETLRPGWGSAADRVVVRRRELLRDGSDFLDHAAGRNQLLRFALEGDPSHILAIDADEFVSDGAAVRGACRGDASVLSLTMREVWEIDGDCLCVREDGGWRSHEVALLWRPSAARDLQIIDRGPATGRTPPLGARAVATGASVLHLGWANRTERRARYDRYAVHDGGRFHASAHLESIMWPDDRVSLAGVEWPDALWARRAAITARALDTDRPAV